LRGAQRRCVWAVGRLGVAACLACVAAAAVDRQARQSCRVWCAGVNLFDCSERVQTSVGDSLELSGIPFTPPKRTQQRQDNFVVSGAAV